MSQTLIFESTGMGAIKDKIRDTFKPDIDGYYNGFPVFALNIFNSAGEFYSVSDKVLELFNANSTLEHRLKQGLLHAEMGHPKMEPGMTKEAWFKRVLEIREDRICGHFKKIEVDLKPTKIKSQTEGIYLVRADVKPTGPFGSSLEDSLKNPNANTSFSIRSLSKSTMVGGIKKKEIQYIVTFDFVPSGGGISVAKKSFDYGFESLPILDITQEDIASMVTNIENNIEAATESEKLALGEVKEVLMSCSNGQCIYDSWK